MTKKLTLSWPVLILIIISTFLAGAIWKKAKMESELQPDQNKKKEKYIRFQPSKSDRPMVKIYLQSFSQKDKLLVANLKKVVQFFNEKISWQPHYFFSSTTQPENNKNCMATEEGVYFCSPLGKQQINQNIRELCAWKLTTHHLNWWNFINSVHQNCSLDKVDRCWQDEAKKNKLATAQIQNCFSTQGVEIIKNQIKNLNQNNIVQTPRVIINKTKLPISEKIGESNLVVKIGSKYFQDTEVNKSEYFITAICSAFSEPPEICK